MELFSHRKNTCIFILYTTLLSSVHINSVACEPIWIWTKGCMKSSPVNSRNITDNVPSRCLHACGSQTLTIGLQSNRCSCNFVTSHRSASDCLPCDRDNMTACGNAVKDSWSVYERAKPEELEIYGIPRNLTGCVSSDPSNKSFRVENCNTSGIKSICVNVFNQRQVHCDNNHKPWSTNSCKTGNGRDILANNFDAVTNLPYYCRRGVFWIGLFSVNRTEEPVGSTLYTGISSVTTTKPCSIEMPFSSISPSSSSDISQVDFAISESSIITLSVLDSTTLLTSSEADVNEISTKLSAELISSFGTNDPIQTSVVSPTSSSLAISTSIPSPTLVDLTTRTTIIATVTSASETFETAVVKPNSTKSIKSHKNKKHDVASSKHVTLPVTTLSKSVTKLTPDKINPSQTSKSTSLPTRTTLPIATKSLAPSSPTGASPRASARTDSREHDLIIALGITGVLTTCALAAVAVLSVYVRRSVKNLKRSGIRMTTLTDDPVTLMSNTSFSQRHRDEASDCEYSDIGNSSYCPSGRRTDLRAQRNGPSWLHCGSPVQENAYVLY